MKTLRALIVALLVVIAVCTLIASWVLLLAGDNRAALIGMLIVCAALAAVAILDVLSRPRYGPRR